MRHFIRVAAIASLMLFAARASAQNPLTFETLTDQGFGTGFGNDASAAFPIVNIGGSNRMEVTDTASFQQAGRETSNPGDPLYQALLAASADEANYLFSYDWYVDTSQTGITYGTFLQLATYINTGSGYYAQDFPGAGKDVELSQAQLTSGQVFSGTVSETFAAKGFAIPPAETFFRPGFISNGDGTGVHFYLDNISVTPLPEPASLSLLALALPALAKRRRRA